MSLLDRVFRREPPFHPEPHQHGALGQLTWDSDVGFWVGQAAGQNGTPIALYVWGDARTGPSERAAELLVPLLPEVALVVGRAKRYLVKEFSAQARRPVEVSELKFLDISTNAFKSPYVEANFEWAEQPDWLIRVTLEHGEPVSWGFDD